MRISHLLLTMVFVVAHCFCLAQGNARNIRFDSARFSNKTLAPLFVLKAGNKYGEVDNVKDYSFDVRSINPDWIKEIQVLKDIASKSQYGDRGANCVVIISFKDFNILSKELQSRFTTTKELGD